jgi:tRNA/tmRNA/rRNA uracil-C5-methylase (TrmA/RlmC/RlmD family)
MIEEVRAGDTLRAHISTVAFGGHGIARIGEIVAFIPFTVDGDVVDITVTEVKKNFIRGELQKIIQPSPQREMPRCPYYSLCGGCQYQHISYDHQLTVKERQVRESFQRIGKLPDPPVRGIIPSPAAYQYRGKADFHCDLKHKKIGFMDTEGGTLVDIEQCLLTDDSINEELEKLRSSMRLQDTGCPRERRCTIWSDNRYKAGAYITRQVLNHELRVPYRGFFQGNTFLTEKLVETVLSMTEASSSEVILDCYCGSGLFALFLAPCVRKVFGIEIDRRAVDCARHNFRQNGYANGEFLTGNAEDILKEKFIGENIPVNTLLLDPPREGCPRGVLDLIPSLRPSKVVYVSCNPATQARDIRHVTEQGFSLKVLQPIDMFPHTKHIEVIALLARKE